MNAPQSDGSTRAAASLTRLATALASVLRGKPEVIRLLLTGVISGGHVLIEDIPGVGKTTLAKALARLLGLNVRRIQFTPDLLPTDILGTQLLHPDSGSFTFQRGPIFTNILLADEINRASPRTQSALLEAMSEGQVTVDGESLPLPAPFIVLATQNPIEAQGTWPLPEAQLDRFMLRLAIGYPDAAAELAMLKDQMGDPLEKLEDQKGAHPLDDLQPLVTAGELDALTTASGAIHVAEPVSRYGLDLISATRDHEHLQLGASPRGTLMLLQAARAEALLTGRSHVRPDDLQAVAEAVLAHRLILTNAARYGGITAGQIVREIIASTDVPA